MQENEEIEQGANGRTIDEDWYGYANKQEAQSEAVDEVSTAIVADGEEDVKSNEVSLVSEERDVAQGEVLDEESKSTEESEEKKTCKCDSINFLQGNTDRLVDLDKNSTINDKLEAVKEAVQDFFNMRNIHFLFGSGTSAVAIPTMSEMYKKVEAKITKKGCKQLIEEFNKISGRIKNKNNLEDILGILYSHKSYLGFTDVKKGDPKTEAKTDEKEIDQVCDELIKLIEKVIFESINIDLFKGKDFDKLNSKSKENLFLYKEFYRKLALRNKDLARLNIFTTNNDLYNEYALDSLNVHYINGFSGGISKFFNPALFNYNFSKRMDTSIEKFEPVENMVYLYKVHGSINWIEDEQNANTFFNIKEVPVPQRVDDKNVLIYPAPTKQNKSLGSPYVEMFREFQKKLLEPHSVLFVIGYSFSDEHVNNVIYQALATNSTINVVILGDVSEEKIGKVDDNRIFKIWGDFSSQEEKAEAQKYVDSQVTSTETNSSKTTNKKCVKIHYFEYFVKELIPNLDAFKKEDDILGKFLDKIKAIDNKEGNSRSILSKLNEV